MRILPADAYARVVVTGTTVVGGRLVRYLTADRRGRFALKLPPGVYTIGVGAASLAQQPHTRVIVRRGHVTRARITVTVHAL